MTNKKPEEWEALETDLHRQMYAYYCEIRTKNTPTTNDPHGMAVFSTSIVFKVKNTEMQNIAATMHWDERYSRNCLQLPVDTSNWGKEEYRRFVKDAVDKINTALKGAQLEGGITNAKDLKSAVDALEKLTRLDLTLMGEASEHISIDINKRPDEMTDAELENAIMQLQKRLPKITENEETTDDGEDEGMS